MNLLYFIRTRYKCFTNHGYNEVFSIVPLIVYERILLYIECCFYLKYNDVRFMFVIFNITQFPRHDRLNRLFPKQILLTLKGVLQILS